MKTLILSFLLHHANRNNKSPEFYAVKNKLLKLHGKHIGYDVQFIEGKKCHTCGGSGIYTGYYWESGERWQDSCNRCYGGWYKRPVWNILERVQFGKYIFHQPKERVYKNPNLSAASTITGYIDHSHSKHGDTAHFILMLMYEPGYLRRWFKGAGIGWRSPAWHPLAWTNNVIHLYKYGRRSIPACYLSEWLKSKERILPHKIQYRVDWFEAGVEELPF